LAWQVRDARIQENTRKRIEVQLVETDRGF